MEDIHIINLFLERSEDAIRQVEVKYEKFCFKIAWNILYNTEDSEECVNDTWLITWNKDSAQKHQQNYLHFLEKVNQKFGIGQFQKKNASKRADTHMMDICGEVEKLENTIKDYVEEDIKKKEILNILEKFLSDLKAGDRDISLKRIMEVHPLPPKKSLGLQIPAGASVESASVNLKTPDMKWAKLFISMDGKSWAEVPLKEDGSADIGGVIKGIRLLNASYSPQEVTLEEFRLNLANKGGSPPTAELPGISTWQRSSRWSCLRRGRRFPVIFPVRVPSLSCPTGRRLPCWPVG